jgi:hypothetical protein
MPELQKLPRYVQPVLGPTVTNPPIIKTKDNTQNGSKYLGHNLSQQLGPA